jgi:signal transduction histidine kinase
VVFSARGGNGTILTIEDDGPGCSDEDLERIAQRGVRLDESTEGHGLGLAIARNVASSYGATIEFGRSETLGGFRVAVAFPPT